MLLRSISGDITSTTLLGTTPIPFNGVEHGNILLDGGQIRTQAPLKQHNDSPQHFLQVITFQPTAGSQVCWFPTEIPPPKQTCRMEPLCKPSYAPKKKEEMEAVVFFFSLWVNLIFIFFTFTK